MSKNNNRWRDFFFPSQQSQSEERGYGIGALQFGLNGYYAESKSMKLSAVYAAVNLISNGVAQMPLKTYSIDSNGNKLQINNDLSHILNCQPNKRQTRFTFIKQLIVSMLLKGAGYAYIERRGGRVIALHLVPYDYVTIIPPKTLLEPIKYSITGFEKEVESKDMICLLNFSLDGIQGISTLAYAKHSLELASNAEASANGFYKGGAACGGVLSVNSVMSKEAKKNLKESWKTAFNPDSGSPLGIAVLEGGMTFQPIAVNPEDAQLLSVREFSVVEIARWFNISPTLLGDLSKSSYSTLEMTNLQFLTHTLQPIVTKLEQEFECKLGDELYDNCHLQIKFDTTEILRSDKTSLASYYTQLYNIGVLSPNEIRRNLDLEPIEDGDTYVCQSNLVTLKNLKSIVPSNKSIEIINEDKTPIE